ncbi:E3 ubiquitin-protein ligase BRE1 [Suhomyces tanzawaensis NRRL Y-17324]|uniref:E3 ubiquitin protein ligase n=1 Tax=Suhomyces tanzawaensis NRRL Y-17324 TaxID=984487 RepID=A0A1E4SPY5_9ASCO|nr:E3 ubiquitin-protein ligase BRE1 [Suhomyces tanzawaensis NRRL Y-17324]ODV81566.1 E3 ubiquitin-protein ligase BRE1 [Suhomyces tanzawaensis NRRL Y-17324]
MAAIEDRKRSLPDADTHETKKQKPLNVLSEDGPLTQQDVVYFQKEAIWRQMEIYKQKAKLMARDLQKYKRQYEANELKLNILDLWYEQIITLFNGKIDTENSELNESLLIRVTNNDESSSIDDVLERRRVHLLKVLSPIIDSLKSSALEESRELINKLEKLNSELTSAKASNESLTKTKLGLEEKVETLQQDILNLIKEKERVNSKTLQRLDGNSNNDANGTDEKEDAPNGQTEVKQEVKLEKDASPDAKPVDNEEYEQLTSQLEELKSTNALLTSQIQEITDKNSKSQLEILLLDTKLHNLQEADLSDNMYYKNVVKNNRSLQDQIMKLTKINDANITRLSDLESKQNDLKQLISKQLVEENESLKEQLHKSEGDLVRIRTTRDELISKQSILKSQLENQKTNAELSKLNQVLSSRIEQLEAEHLSKLTEDNSKLSELSKEDLINRVNILSNEMKEIEAAFKETREVSLKKLTGAIDQENLVKKLTIEKTKADQKYFASMRLKDSIQSENKVLKAQVNKSQDLIKNLNELEKNYLNKVDILTKSINDYKTIKENSLQENAQLQDSVKGLRTSKESLENEVKKLTKSLEARTDENSQLQAEVAHSKITINKLEKTLKSTESLLKKYKQNNTSLILQEDEQQLEALRSIAKCSVCSKNWKDTVISVCGHVFCHKCTQERLAARLRRCPSCNKGFSANDLLTIHL